MNGLRKSLKALSKVFRRDPFSELVTAIAASGLTPPPEIIADAGFQRFSSSGRRNDKNGWYIAHNHPVPHAFFGCWRSGMKATWSSITDDMLDDEQRTQLQQQMRAANELHKEMLAERQALAQKMATDRWNAGAEVGPESHPYLVKKSVGGHDLRIEDDLLLISITDSAGIIQSLQTIKPTGEKRFLSGGKVKGCFHKIGQLTDTVIVCEGYATAATLHEATGLCCVAAFSASNLPTVAGCIRRDNPDLRILIAADDDWKTSGNPGLTHGKQAANVAKAALVIPIFPANRNASDTDFNDLQQLSGVDAVKNTIQLALHKATEGQCWLPPKEVMPSGGTAAKKFHWDLLPESLRPWIFNSTKRMQSPPDYVAVACLVSIAGLIGAKAVITPKALDKSWRVIPTLWGIIIGLSAAMKSPCLQLGMDPINQFQKAAAEKFNSEFQKWRASEKVDPLAAGDKPAEKIYMINDTSVESLAEILETEQWGFLVYRDELIGLLNDMEKKGQESARSFYLTAFDGNQSYSLKRISRGYHYIPRLCLSLLGGAQPGALASHVDKAVSGGSGNDGLLQRFSMAVWPEPSKEYNYTDLPIDEEARSQYTAIFRRLESLRVIDNEPAVWSYSNEAQALFEEWLTKLETELRTTSLPDAFASHLSKYRKLVPALSLIFALIDTPENGNVVGLPELQRAIAWAEFLRTHAMKIYSMGTPTPPNLAITLLNKLQGGFERKKGAQPEDVFTPREILQKGWAGMKTSEDLQPILDVLVEHGWIRRETKASDHPLNFGRTSTQYRLHPQLMRND